MNVRLPNRAAVALLLIVGGCAPGRYHDYRPVPATEVTRMVAGNSLLLAGSDNPGAQTLLFLDPAGRGFRDARLLPGQNPSPSAMSSVISWRATDSAGLCLWFSPGIGEMQFQARPHRECLRIMRGPAPTFPLAATATTEAGSFTAPLVLRTGNAFPPAAIAQYQLQVRVLFGGHLPDWQVP